MTIPMEVLPWRRYLMMMAVGLSLFMASVVAMVYYIQENRFDSVARDAYDYHMLLQAQQAMDHLAHRLELASITPGSASATEVRPSLNQQLEIAWSRLNDLLEGENAKRLRLIPGLAKFTEQAIATLKVIQLNLETTAPDYLTALEQVEQLKTTFSRTFTNLPAHLLPIQYAQQKQLLQQQYWYYSALGFSSFMVLLLYGVTLRGLFALRAPGKRR